MQKQCLRKKINLILIALTVLLLAVTNAFSQQTKVLPIETGGSYCFAVELSNSVVLVDSGYSNQADKIIQSVKSFSHKPITYVLLTHSHFDHFGSASEIRRLTDAKIVISEGDYQDLLTGTTRVEKTHIIGKLGILFLPLMERTHKITGFQADIVLPITNTWIYIDQLPEVSYLNTAGHTNGSITYQIGNAIFTGDLFERIFSLRSQNQFACDWDEIKRSCLQVRNYVLQNTNVTEMYIGHCGRAITRDEILGIKD